MNIKNNKYLLKVILLATPVILGQIMFIVLHFADNFYISRLGTVEAAGTSLANSLIWMMTMLTSLITSGTIAIISRKAGEKDLKKIKEGAEQSLFLAYICGIIFSLISFISATYIFRFLGTNKEVTKAGLSFYYIFLSGYPFIMSNLVGCAIFQAVGNTKLPMKIFAYMSITNLIIDPLFIFSKMNIFNITFYGLGLGVKGASLASVLANIGANIYLLYRLKKDKRIPLKRVLFIKPKITMIKSILKIGVWSGLNSLSRPLSAIFLQKVIAFHGTNSIAAFNFGIQWNNLILILFEGLKVSITTIIGQELGKKSIKGVEKGIKAGNILGYFIIVTLVLIMFPFAKKMITVFSDNSEIIEIGKNYLHITLIGMIFGISITIYSSVFNGAGNTMPPTLISFFSNWIGKIGFAYLATYIFSMNINCIWIAISLSLILEGICIYFWYLKGNWKKVKI